MIVSQLVEAGKWVNKLKLFERLILKTTSTANHVDFASHKLMLAVASQNSLYGIDY